MKNIKLKKILSALILTIFSLAIIHAHPALADDEGEVRNSSSVLQSGTDTFAQSAEAEQNP